MARSAVGRVLGKGIEFFSIEGLTHVLRVEIDNAKPFLLGSITGQVDRKGTVDYVNKLKLTDNIVPRLRKKSHDFREHGKLMVPMWVSNGTFFGDDCYESFDPVTNVANGPPTNNMILAGTVVHRNRATATASPTIALAKRKRWGYFQDTNSLGLVTLLRENTPRPASYYVNNQWASVITGAGSLIENGAVRMRANAHTRSGGSFDAGDRDPTYCAGPVIALNQSAKVLYLMQDRTPRNGSSGTNAGRNWEQMARYLKGDGVEGDLLTDIKRKRRDGSIWNAIVYDGGSSRSLWVSGAGVIPGYETNRPVPHFICLWGHR